MMIDPLALEATPLAIYYRGRDLKFLGLTVYTIVNGKVGSRVHRAIGGMVMVRYGMIGALGLIAFSTIGFAQPSSPCGQSHAVRAKYKIISLSKGEEFQVYVKVPRRYRTETNYVETANEIRKKYCREDPLSIIYYENRMHKYKHPADPGSTPLAIFYSNGREKRRELYIYDVVADKVVRRRVIVGP